MGSAAYVTPSSVGDVSHPSKAGWKSQKNEQSSRVMDGRFRGRNGGRNGGQNDSKADSRREKKEIRHEQKTETQGEWQTRGKQRRKGEKERAETEERRAREWTRSESQRGRAKMGKRDGARVIDRYATARPSEQYTNTVLGVFPALPVVGA